MKATDSGPDNRSTQVELLEARVSALLALQDIAREVTAELDLDRLLHKILRAAVDVMDCTAGSLLLYDPTTAELVFEVVEGGGGEALEKTRMRFDQGIAGAAFTTGQPVIVGDATTDARHYGEVARRFGVQVRTLIAVPLIAKSSTIGVLEVMNKASGDSFSADEQALLRAFASQSAIAIDNARLLKNVIEERDRILGIEAGVRREVARDLHDGPAQILAAMVMGVRNLRNVIEKAPDRAGNELLELEALGQKALYQVRNILFDLRPIVLETQGIGPALQAYVERLRLVEPFNIELELHSVKTRFKPNTEAVIFSIIQEAVNNAKKHASPRNVWIEAKEHEGYLTIVIRDDGCGFKVAEAERSFAARSSFGLLNMRERAEVARGELKIESQPGRGTRIALRVPLEGTAGPAGGERGSQ